MPRAAFQTGTTTLAPGPRRTLLSRATATSPSRRRSAWRPRRSYSRPPVSGAGGSGTTSPRHRGSTVSPPPLLNARCWLLDLAMVGCRAADTDAKGLMHRVDYDDPKSLKLKYGYAKQAKALGVGMWTATAIDCEDLCPVRVVLAPDVLFSSRAFMFCRHRYEKLRHLLGRPQGVLAARGRDCRRVARSGCAACCVLLFPTHSADSLSLGCVHATPYSRSNSQTAD